MHPKIGIIICGFNENRQFVPNVYIQSVRYAKGIPLLIPLVRSDRMIDDYVSLCDGFLFCGGEDITPLLFGEEPQNGNGKTDITVDLFQIRLMKRVLASRKPVLAICRGMQILNVSCGGTIWQDLSLIPQPTLNHTQQSASRGDVSHRIKIERCSKLKQFVGSCIYVNSFHHQSVKTPGCNKGSALRNLMDLFGITPEECVAFGDQYNDVEMLETVGMGYAMSNAAPGIAGHAKYITDSVEEVLEDILAGLDL